MGLVEAVLLENITWHSEGHSEGHWFMCSEGHWFVRKDTGLCFTHKSEGRWFVLYKLVTTGHWFVLYTQTSVPRCADASL